MSDTGFYGLASRKLIWPSVIFIYRHRQGRRVAVLTKANMHRLLRPKVLGAEITSR
jgi:hypothetical protein